MHTIVLNAGYEPVQIISWQRAICLILAEKAEMVVSYSGQAIKTVSASFPLPSVVRLKTYVRGLSRLVSLTRYNRQTLLRRDRLCCQYCGVKCTQKTVTIDHVVAKSRGGESSFENTVAACKSCNSRKGQRSPAEAGMQLLRTPRKPDWRDLLDESSVKAVGEALRQLGGGD